MDKISQLAASANALNNADEFKALYTKFKREVLLPENILALSPTALKDAAITQKVVAITNTLEIFALSAVRLHLLPQFLTIYNILHSFYIDFGLLFDASNPNITQSYYVIAYYLLSLLVTQTTASSQVDCTTAINNKFHTFQTMLLYLNKDILANPVIQTILHLESFFTSGTYNKLLKTLQTENVQLTTAIAGADYLLDQLEGIVIMKIGQLLSTNPNHKYKLSTIMANYSLTAQNVQFLAQKYNWAVDQATDSIFVQEKNGMADADGTIKTTSYTNQEFIEDLISLCKKTEKIV